MKSTSDEWRKRNPDKVRAYQKTSGAKPKRREAQREKGRREYREHKERVVARLARCRKTEKYRLRINRRLKTPAGRAIHKRYISKPEVQARLKLRRSMPSRKFVAASLQAKRRGATALIMTKEDWIEALDRFGNACAYCGSTSKLTVEHMQPLSRGGQHSRDNVVPACARCNTQKRARTLDEFAALKNFDANRIRRMVSA
jgi:5-methylcytosine-specific restriction endonuclease McrA